MEVKFCIPSGRPKFIICLEGTQRSGVRALLLTCPPSHSCLGFPVCEGEQSAQTADRLGYWSNVAKRRGGALGPQGRRRSAGSEGWLLAQAPPPTQGPCDLRRTTESS